MMGDMATMTDERKADLAELREAIDRLFEAVQAEVAILDDSLDRDDWENVGASAHLLLGDLTMMHEASRIMHTVNDSTSDSDGESAET